MQIITISGNLGKDAELKQTQGGDDICSFSLGVRQGYGDKSSTNWFRCSVWGKRARTTKDFLRKGNQITVIGELTIGEYNGKPQFDVRVQDYTLPAREIGGRQEAPAQSQSALDDDFDTVPF